jgi:hypothetical protein
MLSALWKSIFYRWNSDKVCLCQKQGHEMVLFEGLNISTCCVCAYGTQCLSKAFHYPIQLITYSFWKFFLKPSSEFPSLLLVDVLWCRTLIGCSKNAQELTCHGQLPLRFYRRTDGFLSAFSVSKSPLYCLWSGLLDGFSKLASNFKGASFHQIRNSKLLKLSTHAQ